MRKIVLAALIGEQVRWLFEVVFSVTIRYLGCLRWEVSHKRDEQLVIAQEEAQFDSLRIEPLVANLLNASIADESDRLHPVSHLAESLKYWTNKTASEQESNGADIPGPGIQLVLEPAELEVSLKLPHAELQPLRGHFGIFVEL